MKITVVGTGYVGLVSGACLADVGKEVLCLDAAGEKIRLLEDGRMPIYEPSLQELVQRNVAAGRLHFTTHVERTVQHGTIQSIAVGTPPDEDGAADLQHVLVAARNIGRLMTDYKLVVNNSTVPVGTAEKVREALIIVTEWKEFRSPDFDAPKAHLKAPLIFDGRNLYDPKSVRATGMEYFPIGR